MATISADDPAKPSLAKQALQWIGIIVLAMALILIAARVLIGYVPPGLRQSGGGYDTDRGAPDPSPTTRRAPPPTRVERAMPPGMPLDASERKPYVYNGREYFWEHADCPGRIIHPYSGKPQCPK